MLSCYIDTDVRHPLARRGFVVLDAEYVSSHMWLFWKQRLRKDRLAVICAEALNYPRAKPFEISMCVRVTRTNRERHHRPCAEVNNEDTIQDAVV